jgi:gluconate kinase
MMTQRQQTDIRILQALFTDARFESIFSAIDRLHDAASNGKLAEVTNLSADEVIGWLQDITYTANETIRELKEADDTGCEWEPLFDSVDRPSFN